MICFQRLRSLVGLGISVGALCVAMAGISHAAITGGSVKIGYEVASVAGGSVNGTTLQQAYDTNTKYVVSATPGAVITLNIVALVRNNNGNNLDDGIDGVYGTMNSGKVGSDTPIVGNYGVPALGPGFTNLSFSQTGQFATTTPSTAAGFTGGNAVGLASTVSPTTNSGFASISPVAGGDPFGAASPTTSSVYATAPQSFVNFTRILLGTVTWTVPANAAPGSDADLNYLFFNKTGGQVSSRNVHKFSVDDPVNFVALDSANATVGTSGTDPLLFVLPSVRVTVTPEPGTIALLGLGMAGLVACVRRRRA